jgi:hypothetical protein
MMHKKNLVAAIKVNGKVLRESSERVELPFGSEYSIYLKNLDSVRQMVKITIDGQEVSDGWFILQPNSNIEIERFVKNLDQGNRFKFIERTEQIESHRGVKAEDGLVRIEFKREKIYVAPQITEHHTYHHHYDWDYWHPYWPYRHSPCSWNSNTTLTRSASMQASGNRGQMSVQNCSAVQDFSGPIVACAMASNDAGITVPGSLSDQKFQNVSGFETEASEVMVLRLIGRKGQVTVKVARTVNLRATCDTCGKGYQYPNKFCSNCGTSLERV